LALSLENINRTVDGEVYLKDINLILEPGQINVVLGRTLSGKTSLLRLIAGLDKPDTGRILSSGENVTSLAVQQRNIGMVYQQFINYPNLTVYDNIASPLKLAKVDSQLIDTRVNEIAERLQISQFLSRKPLELSGGQQQRTALGRALVKDADIVLLDEPLANLDYKLRESLRSDLRDLFAKRNCVAIYATTEAQEALALGGHCVLLHQGEVLQMGSTVKQFRSPINLHAANLFSEPALNTIKGKIEKGQLGLLNFPLINTPDHLKTLTDGEYNFAWRPTHASLKPAPGLDIMASVEVDVAEISASESFIHTHYRVNNEERLNWVWQIQGIHNLPNDEHAILYLDSAQLFVFDMQGQCLATPDYEKGNTHG
jgi:glycerol transport system ATP-binding protein